MHQTLDACTQQLHVWNHGEEATNATQKLRAFADIGTRIIVETITEQR